MNIFATLKSVLVPTNRNRVKKRQTQRNRMIQEHFPVINEHNGPRRYPSYSLIIRKENEVIRVFKRNAEETT